MRAIVDSRACKILYNFITSNHMGGKVLLPSNICSDVVETLRYAGMELVFCDISSESLCLDENELMKRLEEVQIVLFVHTYGIENSFDDLFARIKKAKPDVAVVDDKCLCMIDTSQPKNGLADLVLFSTGAKKQVELDGGGFGFIDDQWDYSEMSGSNCFDTNADGWLNKICVENGQLKTTNELHLIIDGIKSHRDKLKSVYQNNLPKKMQLPQEFQQWRFNIWVNNKEEVLKKLFSEGLFASGHYKPFDENCKNAKALFDHVINLFEDRYYTEEQAVRTCEVINEVANR